MEWLGGWLDIDDICIGGEKLLLAPESMIAYCSILVDCFGMGIRGSDALNIKLFSLQTLLFAPPRHL
jgi:hypothetical protein